jgi:hypothetical protein
MSPLLESRQAFADITYILFILLAVCIYLLPTLIGLARRKRNVIMIAVVNIFLGWTLVAWAVMLVESFTSDNAP